MKKFLRNLFSGHIIFITLLLIEASIFLFLQFGMDDLMTKIFGTDETMQNWQGVILLIYLLLRIIGFVVAVIIFFKIINKQEDPEFKIPWIVGMLLLPFFFSIMFIIFGNHGLRKKDRIIIKATRNAYHAHFTLDEATKIDMGHAAGTFCYLNNTTEVGPHVNNKVTYYKTGEEFFPVLLESLKQAKEFIFMEFFIIADGIYWTDVKNTLIEKAKEGVEVRLIYDDMGCSGTIASNTAKYLKTFGIKCYKFHPFRPILSGVYNNRDHRKIVVIDHQMAFTGGMNLADEYGNVIERFGYWKDTMVKIEGSAINNLITIFLQNFDLAAEEVSDYNKYLMYQYPKYEEDGYVMPFGDGPGGIDDALIGEQTYINILNYARYEVFISTPYLIPTYELLDALRNASLRGVKVHLIVPGIPDKKLVYKVAESHFRYLLDAGVNIYRYKPGFNHMKTILADERLAMVGTINFDFRSLVHHFECGTILYRNHCAQDILEDFKQMLEVSEKVPANYKLTGAARHLCSLIKIISTLL